VRHRKTIQTIQTVSENTKERNTQLEDISKRKLYDKGQIAKFLSYHPMTDVRLSMEEGKVVDGFHHLIFRSTTAASNIMSSPFFLAFVLIDNDNGERSIIE
jgi:hypothetical protein